MGDLLKFELARHPPAARGASTEDKSGTLTLGLFSPSSASVNKLHGRTVGGSEEGSPLWCLAIVCCAVVVYLVIAMHVTGQPSYSARANLTPRITLQ
jgi:hypothetical protein